MVQFDSNFQFVSFSIHVYELQWWVLILTWKKIILLDHSSVDGRLTKVLPFKLFLSRCVWIAIAVDDDNSLYISRTILF